jgi:endonuclease I
MKRAFFLILLVLQSILITAQIPTGYYNNANNLTGTPLRQALHDIIDNHTVKSYSSLYTHFATTDIKSNGLIWDIYSDIPGGTPPYTYTTAQTCSNTPGYENGCFNREHSWPQSWFGGIQSSPMYSDLFHVYPTDSYVNTRRSNYPYGEVSSPTWTSQNGSKLGPCAYPGYTGTAFEPLDEFKGDLARTYFYVCTRYYNEDTGWITNSLMSGANLLPWALTMMKDWSLQDPVSAKEIARNNAIYALQGNRNPFIDHPEYACLIWSGGVYCNQVPDIIINPSFTYTDNINYTSYQTASSLTSSNTINAAEFIIQDGAGTNDADALATTLTNISFSTGGSTAIRTAALFDGATKLAETAVNGATSISFSGLSIAAPDNGTKSFQLRLTYLSTVTDKEQIVFAVSAATATGSVFSSANAGGASSSNTGNNNKLSVTATKLIFVQQPSNVNSNTAMSPAVTVAAVDANNNKDLDYVSNMTITSTGTFASATTTVAAVAGLGTFSNLKFSSVGSAYTLAISSGSLTATGNSNTFNISAAPQGIIAGDIAFTRYKSDDDDGFSILTFVDIPVNSVFYFTDNAYTTASGPLATTESTMTWTTPNSIIPIGTAIDFNIVTASTVITPAGNGTASGSLSGLSTSGDQIFLYKGTNSTTPTLFIAGINWGNSGAWLTTGAASSNQSYIPSDLTDQVNAISFTSDLDNGYYNNTQIGSIASLKALINNGTNWTCDNNVQTPPTFSFTSNATTTSINANASIKNINIAAGNIFNFSDYTLTINGEINGTGTFSCNANSSLIITANADTLNFTAAANTLKNLTLNSAAKATIGNALNICAGASPGTITLNLNSLLTSNGFLTLKSDASGTARVAQSLGTIVGDVTLERYIPNTRRAYRFLASAITTDDIFNNWQESGNNNAGLGIQITGVAGASPGGIDDATGLDKTLTGANSMYTFDAATQTWQAITNTKDNGLAATIGYRVLVRGDRTTNLYAGTTPAATVTTIKATGTLNQGSITTPTLADGFNLVGNPYASAIDWDATGWNILRTNINNAMYIYNPAVTASVSSTTYPTWAAGVGTNGRSSGIIQSGQSFFIRTTASTTLTFNESYKVASSTGGYFKNKIENVLRIALWNKSNRVDDIIIRLAADAQLDFDNYYDAYSFGTGNIGLASIKNSEKLAIQARPIPINADSVALSLNINQMDSLLFKFENTSSFNSDLELFLADAYTHNLHPILSDSIYNFQTDSNFNSQNEDRFQVIIFRKNANTVNQYLNNISLKVYPNPAENMIYLISSDHNFINKDCSYTIYNELGQNVSQGSLMGAKTINIQDFSKGIYFLQLQNKSQIIRTKFLK